MLTCRSLGGFKYNVRNKTAPGGCIVEGYIATKLVTFCSRHLHDAPTFHVRPQRHLDGSIGAGTRFDVDQIIIKQIHHYIIFNLDDFLQLRE
jgi:hypothetical protein